MSRGSNGLEAIILGFSNILKPFRSYKWALIYIAFGILFLIIDLVLIENPAPTNIVGTPFEGLLEAIKSPFRKYALFLAALFTIPGTLGLLTCLIRDLIEEAARR